MKHTTHALQPPCGNVFENCQGFDCVWKACSTTIKQLFESSKDCQLCCLCGYIAYIIVIRSLKLWCVVILRWTNAVFHVSFSFIFHYLSISVSFNSRCSTCFPLSLSCNGRGNVFGQQTTHDSFQTHSEV